MKKNTEGDDMVMEQKYEMGGKMLLRFFLSITFLRETLHSLAKVQLFPIKYAFSCKPFVFSHKSTVFLLSNVCVLSQNIYILSENN